MKAGSLLSRLVTNYCKDSSVQWRMQDCVNGEASLPFTRSPQGRRFGDITRKKFQISCVAIAVENLPRRRRRKNCDSSTNQSNNFGVSRKRFKPSTPWSTGGYLTRTVSAANRSPRYCYSHMQQIIESHRNQTNTSNSLMSSELADNWRRASVSYP